mgnify:CR=1 FL=1
MNIRKALLEPPVQLKPEAAKIAAYAASSPKRFDELTQCFLSNEYRLQQRAAWCVSMAVRKNNKLIQPYINTLVQQLNRKDVHNAIHRNSLRILQDIDIPEAYTGELMNACFNFVESPQTPIAIKAFALTVLGNLAMSVPEIRPEIKLIINFNIGHESPAFKVRAREVLKKIGL